MNKEQAINVRQGTEWPLICEEIDKRIDSERSNLENAKGEAVQGVQARIRTLRGIKRLPQDVIDREEA